MKTISQMIWKIELQVFKSRRCRTCMRHDEDHNCNMWKRRTSDWRTCVYWEKVTPGSKPMRIVPYLFTCFWFFGLLFITYLINAAHFPWNALNVGFACAYLIRFIESIGKWSQ